LRWRPRRGALEAYPPNNPLEGREIRRRTRVVSAFPDGQSALNLAAGKLRHIAGTAWSTKQHLNIELLKDQQMRGAITSLSQCRKPLSPNEASVLLLHPEAFVQFS
jgi:hypothetical protein